ncbi:MAG TPA: S53 family peptidase [Solirubrobacteraceae bacterium]|nr:S53 family peptidase [Solirubrobacteraceae bacterium]
MKKLWGRHVVVFPILAALALPAGAAAASTRPVVALPQSVTPTLNRSVGVLHRASMSIEVALAPSHRAALNSTLSALYNPRSARYRHWLSRGQFAARFAPSAAERAAVAAYLRSQGLTLQAASSPFLVRASGSSSQVSAAFRTSLRAYVDRQGKPYFANATPVHLPASLAGSVLGVLGLTDTVRLTPSAIASPTVRLGAHSPHPSSCQTPYPSRQLLFDTLTIGVLPPLGYGGGPGCSGLTPSQDNSIYGAPNAGPAGQGAGVNDAVIEFSGYTPSDIPVWWHQFYGSRPMPPVVTYNVDGGPLAGRCPKHDTCPPSPDYSGDIEVDLDIEMQLAIAPAVHRVTVYSAPNDETGQTALDLYGTIANQDTADVVSASWGECEQDAGAALLKAENVIFEQMAAQGQSMFASAGDTGAFDCIGDGTSHANALAVDDPASQPWVTAAGGTSLESFNPAQNPNPSYPPPGTETVWNPDGLCNQSANEGGQTGFWWCSFAGVGAGGGGTSAFWGRQPYQSGPGVNSSFSTQGNGKTQCALAARGTPCREVPDISVNADEFTPYSEYCTGDASTNSICATIASTPAGWFPVGGTSASSQFWGGIIADRDGYIGQRSGNAAALLYALFNTNYNKYFHDITGIHQYPNNNGYYPTTPGYDMATGIGTPIMSAIITGR